MLNKQRAADTGRKDGRTKEGKRMGPLILLNPTEGKHRRSLRRGYDFFQIHFESYLKLRHIHPFRKLPPQFSKKEKKDLLIFFLKRKAAAVSSHGFHLPVRAVPSPSAGHG